MQFLTQYIDIPPTPSLKQQQIEEINRVLIEIAGGNFDYLAPISESFDEIDAIASGVNMLSEELRDTVISRNYLDSVLRSVVDMLFIFDKNFVIRQTSKKACELLKQPEDYFVGKPVNAIFDGRKWRFVQRLKDQSYQEGEVLSVQTAFRTPGSEKLPVVMSVFALKNNCGLTNGYLMIAENVKDKLLTSNALKRKNEELKTFIYRASHDLKGPLASMLGLFHALELEREKESTITLKTYLTLLKKSAEQLNDTLSGLLEIGAINQTTIAASTFNVYEVIQDIIDSLSNYPGRGKVDLHLQGSQSVLIKSNKNIVKSILQNLIENSIKYRQFKDQISPFVRIRVRQLKNAVSITVRDNGQGMDKNVLKSAFTMFYRGNTQSEGSGLGLFIVKSSVEKLGGTVRVKSEVNQGTEVKVTIPIIQPS